MLIKGSFQIFKEKQSGLWGLRLLLYWHYVLHRVHSAWLQPYAHHGFFFPDPRTLSAIVRRLVWVNDIDLILEVHLFYYFHTNKSLIENDSHFHIIPNLKRSIITSNLPRTGRSLTNPLGNRSVRAVEDANAGGCCCWCQFQNGVAWDIPIWCSMRNTHTEA